MNNDSKEFEENHSDFVPQDIYDSEGNLQLTGMFQTWFIDYASYVILERAVPHLGDGLKPVQRRILHAMKRKDDGRYTKVANIVGETMLFHPHGDASIKDALVQLGQKDLLVDTQGNWGNILTGDDAAASRYIEARLSKFALDVLFNPKTTEWKLSYDGRNKEPVCLPVKFPLLLAQGAEGIAVGLSSKILPHNFKELCDAAIHYLRGESFCLYPDFPTGGLIDISRYNDGLRGGSVKVRARIEKIDNKTLVIREIPFGKTTTIVIDSILKANEKGKIKIRKVDDNTAAEVEILVHLVPGTSPDKAIDALYAFTDCEISISPNCCVIENKKPIFLTVSNVLCRSTDTTRLLLEKELRIQREELVNNLFFASLERIFIEERIYKDKEFEQAKNMDVAVTHIDKRLEPFKQFFIRPITRDDILHLMDIKMGRILKFNKDKADENIARINAEIKRIDHDLENMVEVTINWYKLIREKYASQHPRKTEIRSFDNIEATKVIEANEKLYFDRKNGFIGTSLKKEEFVSNCSPIDDVIIFYRDGTYKITKIQEKLFIGETEKAKKEKKKAEVIHINIFRKNDNRTIYNVVYRDGETGTCFIKRFNVTGVTHDKEYDLTTGTLGSRILYFTANSNGEAEVIKITLRPNPKLKRISFEKDFSDILVKGRQSRGNLLTRLEVHKISLKTHGASTLGDRKVWFDFDVQRINYDGRGKYLGEFSTNDRVLVILDNGKYYTTTFDTSNHYEATGLLRVEKFDDQKVWSAVLYDADQQGFPYVKRFTLEATPQSRPQSIIGENPQSRFVLLTDAIYPRIKITYGGADAFRDSFEVDVEQYIGVKSLKAKGKRLTTCTVEQIEELPPTRYPEPDFKIEIPTEPEVATLPQTDNIHDLFDGNE